MKRISQLLIISAIAAFIAGCSFSLYMKILPEQPNRTSSSSSIDKSQHEP